MLFSLVVYHRNEWEQDTAMFLPNSPVLSVKRGRGKFGHKMLPPGVNVW